MYPTVDHIWPKSMGGSSKEENLCLLCLSCHREKDYQCASYKIMYESLMCSGSTEFSGRFLRRFKINPKASPVPSCQGLPVP
jgi:HNH endonuclease